MCVCVWLRNSEREIKTAISNNPRISKTACYPFCLTDFKANCIFAGVSTSYTNCLGCCVRTHVYKYVHKSHMLIIL